MYYVHASHVVGLPKHEAYNTEYNKQFENFNNQDLTAENLKIRYALSGLAKLSYFKINLNW